MRRTHRNFMAPEDIKRLLSNKLLCFTVRSLGQASTYFSILYIFYRGKRLGVLYPLLYSPSRWRAMLTISFLNDGLAFLKTLKTKCIYLYQQLLASFIKNVWVFMDMIFEFNIRMIP